MGADRNRGFLSILKEPHVAPVCAVLSRDAIGALADLPESVRVVELRLDLMPEHILLDAIQLRDLLGMMQETYDEVIVACHGGGPHRLEKEDIARCLSNALILGARVVDVPLDEGIDIWWAIREIPQIADRHVILSWHERSCPSSPDRLYRLARNMRAMEPSCWVKLAVPCEQNEEARRVLALNRAFDRMIAVPMGEAVSEWRKRLCEYGAPFSYGYYGQRTAPGQPSIFELLEG